MGTKTALIGSSKHRKWLCSLTNNRFVYPIIGVLLLALSFHRYYNDGSFILGGEGLFVIDFLGHLEVTAHNWVSRFGTGAPSLAPQATGINILILALVDTFTSNPQIASFLLVFSLFYLPFLGMYLVGLQVGARPYLAFIVGLFYLMNPSTIEFLNSLNQWNAFAASLIPILCWIILKYYKDNLKLFFFYGLTTTLFCQAFTNAPLNIIIILSSLLSTYIASLYLNNKLMLLEIVRKCCLIMVSFALFNFWWIGTLFYLVRDALKVYPMSNAQSWLVQTVNAAAAPIGKSFSLTQISPPISHNFHGAFYHNPIVLPVLMVPLLLVIWAVFFVEVPSRLKQLCLHIFLMTVLALFLLKGVSEPFGFIFQWLFDYIPFFMIFKTPVEKFGLLYTFLFSYLLLFALHSCKKSKTYPHAIRLICGYLLLMGVPFLMGNIIPDYKVNPYGFVSRQYIEKPADVLVRNSLNKDKLIYRVLSLPGRGNYQMLLSSSKNKFYSGLDPILPNTNKPVIAAHDGDTPKVLYRNILITESDFLLDFLCVKKLALNERLITWFGTVGAGPKLLKQRFASLPHEQYRDIRIYNRESKFLPLIYTPNSLAMAFHMENLNED